MDHQWIQQRILGTRKRVGIEERLTAHSLRHAYATHSYENGMNLLTLRAFLGHKSLNSTVIYVYLAAARQCAIANPLEQIGGGLLT